jgi:hypothetical protein
MAEAGPYSCILTCLNASHAARCVACHGVRSHPVPVASAEGGSTLVGVQPLGLCLRERTPCLRRSTFQAPVLLHASKDECST